ncbi:MAG: hypothetical protein PHV34_17615 [Verrucomicrobiae bacterium]|nr:hypothetical protein [Verrucomicrobiae bacterium]
MCDSIALAATSLALTVASTGMGAISAAQQQKSQNAAAEYNARIAERNAQQSELLAQDAIARGKIDAEAQRKETALKIGAFQASRGGSGLLVNSGSNLDVREDMAGFGELDALTIENNADREAWQLRNQATDYTLQANLARMSKRSSALAVGSSILTGTSKFGTDLYGYRDTFKIT